MTAPAAIAVNAAQLKAEAELWAQLAARLSGAVEILGRAVLDVDDHFDVNLLTEFGYEHNVLAAGMATRCAEGHDEFLYIHDALYRLALAYTDAERSAAGLLSGGTK